MYPSELKYTKEHEWVKISTAPRPASASPTTPRSSSATWSISSCPRSAGRSKGDVFGTIESVKAVSELYAPVSGEVTAVNQSLTQKPESVNSAPHDSWMIEIKFPATRRPARRRAVHRAHEVTDEHPNSFQSRHIGPAADARDDMLRAIGVPSLDALIDQTIPPGIRADRPLDLPEAETEYGYLRRLRTHRRAQRRGALVHRDGLLRLHHAERDPAQRVREPRLVHALHTVPGRDRAGPPRVAAQLPDRRQGPDRHGHRDRVAARRGHRRRRGDDDVPSGADEEGEAGAGERVPGVGPLLPADAGRAARPRRAARHRPGDWRSGRLHRRAARSGVRAPVAVSRRPRRGRRSARGDRTRARRTACSSRSRPTSSH